MAPDRDTASSNDPAPGSSEERIEELLVDCLEADDPDAALERAATANPELAAELRAAFAEIARLELVGDAPADPASSDEMPERLGDHRLVERLGAGGMGVVFLARDDVLQRTVALKLIRPEHVYLPGARERFQREVETIARLQHPGIVPIYGVGKADGMPYFTMQHVPGRSLSQALSRLRRADEPPDGRALLQVVAGDDDGDPDAPGDDDAGSTSHGDRGSSGSSSRGLDGLAWPDACVAVAIQVASALAHAHERGVLHRDVKPSNILLTPDGRAMLVDFGLAWTDTDQRLTHTSSQLGSLPYLPPEHVDGRAPDPSRATDVYSLGVTLYEMLTRRNPFLGKTSEETRRNILGARALRLRREQRGVSWELETVCMTAMDPDPSKRYRTMLDFQRDLERVRDRQSIEARRPGLLRRASRWAQRHPTTMAAAGVALVTGLAALGVFAMRERQARVQSDALRESAEVERYGALLSSADIELRSGQRPLRARSLLADCRARDRGWEWSHLEYATDESRAVASDLGGPVQDLRFAPRGDRYVVSTQDQVLTCRDLDHRVLWRVTEVPISELAWRQLPDGGHELLTARLGGELQVRSPDDGALVATFSVAAGDEAPAGELTGLAVSPDGARVYSTSSDGSVSVWDARARAFVRTIGKHDMQGHCLTLSADGSRLVTGGFDRTVRAFDTATFEETARWQLAGWCLDVAFCGDGEHVVLTDSRGLLLLDVTSPDNRPRPADRDARTVLATTVSPDGRWVAAAISRRVLRVYRVDGADDTPRLSSVSTMIGHEGLVQHLAFSPDSALVLSGSTDQTLRMWEPSLSASVVTRPHERVVQSLAFGPRGALLSGDTNGDLRLGLPGGPPTQVTRDGGAPAHDAEVVAVLATDGAFVSVDAGGVARRWRLADEGLQLDGSHETGVAATAATLWPGADGEQPLVVLGDEDGAVVVASTPQRRWQAHDERVTALARVGDRVWSAAVDGTLRCWDLRTGARTADGPDHPSWIAALAAAPDGSWLASSCADTAVRVFDPDTGALRHRLDGHGRAPLALVSDPTGARLISGGGFDNELRFWHPSNGRCLLSLPARQATMSLAFDPARGELAIGSRTGHVLRLRSRPGGARPFDERPIPVDTITSAPGGAGRRHR